jgi:hypothetical protein
MPVRLQRRGQATRTALVRVALLPVWLRGGGRNRGRSSRPAPFGHRQRDPALLRRSTNYGPPLTAGTGDVSGHYSGTYLWNLNARQGVHGHFHIPHGVPLHGSEPLRARVDLTLIDIYGREHRLLPTGFIKPLDSDRDWYFEPAEEELQPR